MEPTILNFFYSDLVTPDPYPDLCDRGVLAWGLGAHTLELGFLG